MSEERFRSQFTVDFKRHKTTISVHDTEKDLLYDLKLNACIRSQEALNIIELLKKKRLIILKDSYKRKRCHKAAFSL